VVCLVSGGNNDVSRYGEILERSLVHLGLKHYFLVDFPQEPGALRRFLDGVLGPNDDITLFEYVKRNNRETGEALVGIELGSAAGLDGLLERMRATEMQIEKHRTRTRRPTATCCSRSGAAHRMASTAASPRPTRHR
jgi:threonine dehydratase